jgi:hypothetical protein
MKKFFATILFVFGVQSWSCGVLQTVAVNSTTGIIDFGLGAIFEESDLQLAEQSIPANITLLEALYRAKDKNDDHLALLLTEAYTGYALGFVEDTDPERAKALYKRASEYGLTVLRKNKRFASAFDDDPEQFKAGVAAFSQDDVPIIFWTANAWGNLVKLSIADPSVLGDLHKVNALMEFVLQNEERFYYGSAHLYFGMMFATTPKSLGGKPDSAKVHFDKCLAIGERRFLLPYVYMAQSYAVQVQDKALFESSLKTVEEASLDILPEQRLVNAIAKRKAKALLAKEDDLFF